MNPDYEATENAEDTIEIVWKSPGETLRVAKIYGKYYPYGYSKSTHKPDIVFLDGWALRQTEENIKWVSSPFDELWAAKHVLRRRFRIERD